MKTPHFMSMSRQTPPSSVCTEAKARAPGGSGVVCGWGWGGETSQGMTIAPTFVSSSEPNVAISRASAAASGPPRTIASRRAFLKVLRGNNTCQTRRDRNKEMHSHRTLSPVRNDKPPRAPPASSISGRRNVRFVRIQVLHVTVGGFCCVLRLRLLRPSQLQTSPCSRHKRRGLRMQTRRKSTRA